MENTKNTTFLSVPYNILYLDGLTLSAKILLAEILSLSKLEGHCFASNEYFSERLGISERAVCNALNELKKCHLISSTRKGWNKRYLHPVFSKLKERNICTSHNANSAQVKRNFCTSTNADSAHYNNRYNNKDNINYKENRKRDYFIDSDASYDIVELMKIP